ncbi:MAG: TonB-dependent receptor [Betaproteobacteria bacterium]|nr:TonB-dependent receptor [Betaproteobacteria bacterium]
MKKQFKHQSRKKVLSVAIGLAVAAVASPWSYAQTAAKGDAVADLNKLETVVVSAQRRDEEMQKVPISITTINVKDIEQKQIRRLDDIKFEVPNIVVEPNTGTSSGAKVFMRGVGTDESLFSADPSVAIYIDDVYIPRQTGALFDLFDVQRIEVLRGPQGTLYGRNATGGAIRYVTAKPNGQEKFEIDGRIGNLARQDIRAGLSTKLGENVDATFAVMSKNRDGYLKDITNGGKVNDEQVYGARASFGMNFGASSRATLALDSVKQRSGPTYASGIIDPATALRVGRPVNNADGDLLTIQTDLPNGLNDLDQSGVSLVTSTSFDGMDWRNILAYRRMSNLLYIDVDGTAQTPLSPLSGPEAEPEQLRVATYFHWHRPIAVDRRGIFLQREE